MKHEGYFNNCLDLAVGDKVRCVEGMEPYEVGKVYTLTTKYGQLCIDTNGLGDLRNGINGVWEIKPEVTPKRFAE